MERSSAAHSVYFATWSFECDVDIIDDGFIHVPLLSLRCYCKFIVKVMGPRNVNLN